MTPRVLVVDDDPLYAEAAMAILSQDDRLDVVGRASDGREAVELALSLRPDVVLMDVAMPILDGVAATARIRPLLPGARIVAFAGSAERDVVEAMLEAGADAYCVKGAPLWELERAIAGAGDPLLRLAHALAVLRIHRLAPSSAYPRQCGVPRSPGRPRRSAPIRAPPG